MRHGLVIGFLSSFMILFGCDEEPGIFGNRSSSGTENSQSWLIPQDKVQNGGPGKDGIPALEDPEFIAAGEADYLAEDDLVIGFVSGNEARAYPHDILDWHEIVNDRAGEKNIAVTYCPLTGTGIGWNREINGELTTFGVSGLLYNSNLIPYDRASDSNWSQIRLDCVNGKHIGEKVETFPMVETTWGTWKSMYPDTRVLSTNTGHDRFYGRYPYGDYRTNDDYLIFPVAHEDNRVANKERVLGVVQSGNARIYRFSDLSISVTVIQDVLNEKNLVIAGNREDNFMIAYVNDPGDGTVLSFSAVQGQYPVVMSDEEGNMWDVNGRAVSGPREGARLGNIPSFMGYWFSFAAFYPGLSLYGD